MVVLTKPDLHWSFELPEGFVSSICVLVSRGSGWLRAAAPSGRARPIRGKVLLNVPLRLQAPEVSGGCNGVIKWIMTITSNIVASRPGSVGYSSS